MKHVNVALFVPHAGCPHRCSFCDQTAITGRGGLPSPAEVARSADIALQSGKVDPMSSEIAFFGGSFFIRPAPRGDRALAASGGGVCAPGAVFRASAFPPVPNAVDEETVAYLQRYHVKAVELGAQSMDEAVLLRNGRGHTPRGYPPCGGPAGERGAESWGSK